MKSPKKEQQVELHPFHVSQSINNLIEERNLARSQVLYQKQLIIDLQAQVDNFKNKNLAYQKELARLSDVEEKLLIQREAFEKYITTGKQLINQFKQDLKGKPVINLESHANTENTGTRSTTIKRKKTEIDSVIDLENHVNTRNTGRKKKRSAPVEKQSVLQITSGPGDDSTTGSLKGNNIFSPLESISSQVKQLKRSDLYKLLDISVCKAEENTESIYRLESQENMINSIVMILRRDAIGTNGCDQLDVIQKHIHKLFNASGFINNFRRQGSRMITAATDEDLKGAFYKIFKVRML